MDQDLASILMDNIPDGIYVLDSKGVYLYANSVYLGLLNMTKADLIGSNVHSFLDSKQIDFCIADIVYREKRRVSMLQDLFDKRNPSRIIHRQLVISSPIFGKDGEVCNIVSVVRPIHIMNSYYHEAALQKPINSCRIDTPVTAENVVAESSSMVRLLNTAENVANVDSSVLLTGESGTGKEVVAKYIHNTSGRRDRPMIIINCASLPPALLEAELFGYEKGAFTGASSSGKAGLFAEAGQSTLFLDEINSLPLDLQGKLLRAIETKTIQRIGSTKSYRIDFRLIVATNENLQDLVAERRFRSDLYYRLNVIPLNIPPLRERSEDILPLAFHFLKHYCEKYNRTKLFSDNTLQAILQYDWPGNVRELKNFVERSVVMSMGDYIEIQNIRGITSGIDSEKRSEAALPIHLAPYSYGKLLEEGVALDDYLAQCESGYLKHAMSVYKSSYLTAQALGTSQSSIMRRKKKYNF